MKTYNVSITFPWVGILTALFVTLKLTGTISWSWWWVFLPLLLCAGVIAFAFVGLVVVSFFLARAERKFFRLVRKQRVSGYDLSERL